MTLEAWLKKNKITQDEFAEQTGISQSTISKMIKGRQKPSFDHLVIIERETKGKVKFADFERFFNDAEVSAIE